MKLKQLLLLICVVSLTVTGCSKEDGAPVAPKTDDAPAAVTETTTEKAPATPEVKAPAVAAIAFETPDPMFIGTPEEIDVENLEPPVKGKRAPFMAPVGVTNLAAGKSVSVLDDEEPMYGELEMITDGDKSAADGSYVELGVFEQYVTIDLGAEHKLYALLFWHYHKQGRVYNDVIVELSTDATFPEDKSIVLFNNDHDDTYGRGEGKDMNYVDTNAGKLLDAKGHVARYVRLHSNGNNTNDMNHYIEVEVFGL